MDGTLVDSTAVVENAGETFAQYTASMLRL